MKTPNVGRSDYCFIIYLDLRGGTIVASCTGTAYLTRASNKCVFGKGI